MKTKKLSDKDLKQIRKLLESENRNITQIAKDYGVSRQAIYNHAYSKGWIVIEKKGFFEKIKKIFNKGKNTHKRKDLEKNGF